MLVREEGLIIAMFILQENFKVSEKNMLKFYEKFIIIDRLIEENKSSISDIKKQLKEPTQDLVSYY